MTLAVKVALNPDTANHSCCLYQGMATLSGSRTIKRKSLAIETDEADIASDKQKKIKSCPVRNCPSDAPICFVRAADT